MPDPPFERECLGVSDEEMDEFLAEWQAADRHAAEVLRQALADCVGDPAPEADLAAACTRLRMGLRSGQHPFDWVRRAAALDDTDLDMSDGELLVRCVAATIAPTEETGLEAEEEAAIISLEHADWLGAIVSAVRAGPGAEASASSLAAGIYTCPEVNIEGGVDVDDGAAEEMAFEIVSLPWSAIGLIDQDQRLTPLGIWGLPRGLAHAWGSNLDPPSGEPAT